MENIESIEKNLINLLKDAKAPAGMLKRTSASLAIIGKTDMQVSRVIINGIPWPEWVVIKGRIPFDKLGSLRYLLDNDLIRDIKGFPYGIVNPTEMNISARFNLNGHNRS